MDCFSVHAVRAALQWEPGRCRDVPAERSNSPRLGPNTLLLQIASPSASSTTLEGVLFDCFSTIELATERTTLWVCAPTPYEGAILLTEHNPQAASKDTCTVHFPPLYRASTFDPRVNHHCDRRRAFYSDRHCTATATNNRQSIVRRLIPAEEASKEVTVGFQAPADSAVILVTTGELEHLRRIYGTNNM